MRRIALLIFLAASLSPSIYGQDQDDNKIACYSNRDGNTPQKKKLWDGYEISLGPARNAMESETPCTAAIYNSAGHVVFRTGGFNVVFDENQTGQDFENRMSSFSPIPAGAIIAAGATSFFRFRPSRTNSSRLQWRLEWTLGKSKTAEW